MTPKLKKIIIAVVIIAVAYFAYSMFFKTSDDDANLISGTNSLSSSRNLADTQVLGNQITQALIQIEALTLDRSVFENAIFRSLTDKSEVISPEPVGRRNPFAPLEDTSVNFDSNLPSIQTVDEQEGGSNDVDDAENTEETGENDNQNEPEQPFGGLGL